MGDKMRLVLTAFGGMLALFGMYVVLAALLGGCEATINAGTPFVPEGVQEPPAAVLEASADVAVLFNGAGAKCSAVLMGTGGALSDRHCYGVPQHDGGDYGVLIAHGTQRYDVVAVAQPDVMKDAVILELDGDGGDGNVELALEPVGFNVNVWTAGDGCSGNSFYPVLHSGLTVEDGWATTAVKARVMPATCKGDSGGGMFTADGRLVGLVKSQSQDDLELMSATRVYEGALP